MVLPPTKKTSSSDRFPSQATSRMSSMFIDNAPHVAGSVISLTILAFVLFTLRVYTRLKVAAWGIDDWCMTAAAVMPSVPHVCRRHGLIQAGTFRHPLRVVLGRFIQRCRSPQGEVRGTKCEVSRNRPEGETESTQLHRQTGC